MTGCVWSHPLLRSQGTHDGSAGPRGPLLGKTYMPRTPTPTGSHLGWAGGGGHCVSSTDFSPAFSLCSANSRCEVLTLELGLLASRAVKPRSPAAEARSSGASLQLPLRTRAPPNCTVQLGVCSELETNGVCPVTSEATSESHHPPQDKERWPPFLPPAWPRALAPVLPACRRPVSCLVGQAGLC